MLAEVMVAVSEGERMESGRACEFAKGSDDLDHGCSAHIALYFISTMYGIWVTWGMGYGVLQMYGLLTGFPCIPSW